MQTILISILALIIAVSLFISCFKYRKLGILLIFISIVIYAIFNNRPPFVEIFSLKFHVADAVSFLLFSIVIVDILTGKLQPSIAVVLLLFFGLICFVSLSVGVFYYDFELGKAIGNFYSYFYFFSIGSYTYSFVKGYLRLDKLLKYWIWTAILLCFIAIVKWCSIPFGYTDQTWYSPDANTYLRVLNASQTFFLFYAAVFCLLKNKYSWKYPKNQAYSIVFLIFVVVMQHRTVWVVAAVSLTYITFIYKLYNNNWFRIVIPILAIIVITIISANSEMFLSISNSANNFSTFEWRIASWQAMLNENNYLHSFDIIFGHPFGFGNTRIVNNVVIEFQAHNFYVQTLWDVGIVGSALILMIYSTLLFKRSKPNKVFDQRLVFLLILSQFVYFIPYSIDMTSGLLLGMVMGLKTAHTNKLKKEHKILENNNAYSMVC